MAHSILTNTVITREAARILHQVDNFMGSVNRSYNDQFAKSGAKAGTSINMRLPSKYTVRTGADFSGQDHVERSTPLAVVSQYGVDVSFSTFERTLSLDDFSKRVLQPAMKQLAAKISYDSIVAAYKTVNRYTNATTDTKLTYRYFQKNGQNLTDELAPHSDRTALLTPASSVEFMDATKGLFHTAANLNKQFREGIMGNTGGFDVGENTLLPSHTTGTLAGSPVTDGSALGVTTTANAWSSQTELRIDGATSLTTIKAGDIITLSGVYAVHPETKQNTGRLQTFVVQSDVTLTTAADDYAVTVKPAMIHGAGNAFQNVVLSGVANTDGLTVTRIGAANTAFAQDLFFHKDAFALAIVDLEDVSSYGADCTRVRVDDISLRWIQQYNVSNDKVYGRFDIAWGFAPLLPELASRHLTTQSLLTA
jgi:hypothetical protein